MEYFFAANQFGNIFAGPFKTFEAAVAATTDAPAEMRPAKVEKLYFCPDVNGQPCPECARITTTAFENTNRSVGALKNLAPGELHQ